MNQQFEVKLLLKQNAEMVSKMQIYRRQNQQLIQKNQDLNLWVQNLSQVFAAIGAAWKAITNNQEAIFNLMKKRGDPNSKALISKYVSHFKTFDEIINNLGEKITNSGHSNEVTLDTKARLNAFVQNYQMFFKEIVDSYFKFNDQYLQWITELKNKPQLSQNFRVIANKQIQNKMKIKEFQSFMGEFRGRFKIYQSQNQHKLLDGILFSKNQQINSINQLNQIQTRRIHLMLNYCTQNAQTIIQGQQNVHECFCGGIQLKYFKKEWEKHLQQLRNQLNKQKISKEGEKQTHSSMNKQDYELLEFQKQKLFERISNLQGKIEKMKTQSKLTEQLVLNSSAYSIIHNQTQELIIFVDDLLHKISNHYNFLYEIEKARQEQILELKLKLQRSEVNSTAVKSPQNNKIVVENNLIEFKTTISSLIKQLNGEYVELNNKISIKQQSLSKSKQFVSSLQKEIQDLQKKIQILQSSKNTTLQFRHEKFNDVEKKITEALNDPTKLEIKQKQSLTIIWRQFVDYVKTRDKKIRDLENSIRKKQKELAQKDKLSNVLQQNLKEAQHVFIVTQTQVKKFTDFITNTEKELHALAQKNLSLRTDFQQQKILMNYKTKTQSEAKIKMQEKLRYFESLDEQIKQLKKFTQQAGQNYEHWIHEQENKLMQASNVISQAKSKYQLKRVQSDEKDKVMKKVNQEKQKWKSECTKLGAKFNAIEQKSELGVLKMEMEQYKRKIMCNCSRQQQRSVVLKTCPHAFCKKCIQDMNNSRNRKCPLCGTKFGKSDVHDIILS